MSSPNKLNRSGSKEGERTPALGSTAGRRRSVDATASVQAAPTTGRRNSVAAMFGGPSADERDGHSAQPLRPMPECLDAQNRGKIYLMHDGEPQVNAAAPGRRSGKELWSKLRATLRDNTTRSWLGLTEKADGTDESLMDKTEKKARAEAVLAGMYLDDTRFRQTWDSAQIALLVYIALLVPFRIGFDQNAEPGDLFFIFDVGVDIYFVVDVYLSFNTTRQDSEGKLVWRKRDVRMGYLKGWFMIDLLGCLPLHYLPLLPGIEADSDAMKSNKSVRLLRLARLLKLLRLARINRLLQRYEEQLFAFMSSIKMGKTVLFMVFIGHWMCCLWYYAGSQPQSPDELGGDGEVLEGWVLQNFGGVTNFNHTDVATRYMTSMYYAYATMTTVGYGDISATTYFEKVAAVFAMIIGGFVFGSIVGTLSDLSAQANPLDRVKTKQLSKVVGVLQGRAVKQRVVKEVRKYFALKYQYETAIDLKPYLFELPEALRNDLARELHYISKIGDRDGDATEGIVHHVPFFCDLDNTSLILLCLRMKFWSRDTVEIEEDGTRKNDIFSEGMYGNEMFVIAKGTCEVITTHGKYKDWPTYKEDHILTVLQECGLTEGQAAALQAIESVAQHVKALPDGWSNGGKTQNILDGNWASCGIEHDQASKILEHGSQDSRFALTLATTASNADIQTQIAQVVTAAHSELQQAALRREQGQLWRLPKNPHVRSKDTATGDAGKSGLGGDGWAPARQGHHAEALTIAQKRRLAELKKQYHPKSTSPYLVGLPSCDVTGGGVAAPVEVTGVVKMGRLDTGDFFGESAVLLPHCAKGVVRTRSVYGVQSEDIPNFREVHLFVLSNEDLKQLEVERPAIKHMLLPYRRQAMANAYRERFTGLAQSASRHVGARMESTLEECEDDEDEEDEMDGVGLSPSTRIPEQSTDVDVVAGEAGPYAVSTVSRREFEALSQKVDHMQTQLERMNESVSNKLDELLQRAT